MANTNPNLQFLRGTQADLNKIKNKVQGAVAVQDGAFYLTTDTNRLYVGQGTDLVELNKSVTIVDKIKHEDKDASNLTYLPTSNIEEGQFYYVSNINVLCVWKNGKWVQINPDTKLASVTSEITNVTAGDSDTFDAKVKIIDTFNQTLPGDTTTISPTNTKQFETVNLKVEKLESGPIRFTGDTYQVNVPPKANTKNTEGKITNYNKEAQIELQRNVAAKTGEDAIIKDTVNIVGSKGITSIETDANTQTITITATTNASMTNECDANGTITIGVKETEGGGEVSTTFTPQFIYGKEKIKTPIKFDSNYQADFDVYTTGEVDSIATGLENKIKEHIRANDAMTYKGTIKSFESVSTSLPTSKVSNGDVWMLAIPESVTIGGFTYKAGDFFIASGTETVDAEGNSYIPSNGITWNYIPAGNDTYTTSCSNDAYKAFQIVDGQNANNIIGSVKVIAEDEDGVDADIIVTPDSQAGASGGQNVTYIIKHSPQARTNHNGTDSANQEAASKDNGQSKTTSVTVVDALTVDDNGHVTGWNNKTVNLIDTHNRIDKNKSILTITPSENNTSAELSALIEMLDEDSATYTYSITSKSTNIQVIGSNTTSKKEVGLGLVWGSF